MSKKVIRVYREKHTKNLTTLSEQNADFSLLLRQVVYIDTTGHQNVNSFSYRAAKRFTITQYAFSISCLEFSILASIIKNLLPINQSAVNFLVKTTNAHCNTNTHILCSCACTDQYQTRAIFEVVLRMNVRQFTFVYTERDLMFANMYTHNVRNSSKFIKISHCTSVTILIFNKPYQVLPTTHFSHVMYSWKG